MLEMLSKVVLAHLFGLAVALGIGHIMSASIVNAIRTGKLFDPKKKKTGRAVVGILERAVYYIAIVNGMPYLIPALMILKVAGVIRLKPQDARHDRKTILSYNAHLAGNLTSLIMALVGASLSGILLEYLGVVEELGNHL